MNSTGEAHDHWYISTTAFTIIIHIIIYKLLLETVFWNTISIVTCAVCFGLYYLILILGNLNPFAKYFQPQINGQFLLMLSTGKFWLLIIALPFFALIPDLVVNLF